MPGINVDYNVSIVGSDNLTKIGQGQYIEKYLLTVLLPEIGNIILRHITDKIKAYPFKHQQGHMLNAVKVRIIPNELAVEVYNDATLAPHAIWQEIGVKKQPMLWLIKHKNPNTIPFVIRDGRFRFAGRGSNFFGAPDVKFVRINSASFGKISKYSGKPSWENPGYPGKFFYRDGLVESMEEIRSKFKDFTFRIVSSMGGATAGSN